MKRFSGAKRIVIKLGTNILMKGGGVSREVITSLSRQVSEEVAGGRKIIVVSSGAVGLGSEKLGIKPENMPVSLQQAAAAVGQSLLMHEYEKAFSKHGRVIAQILLTSYNFRNAASLTDMKNKVPELLAKDVLAVRG
jgi:glutamate 5-kinase